VGSAPPSPNRTTSASAARPDRSSPRGTAAPLRRGHSAKLRAVTFVVGMFDLFTYTIPGSLYLAFFGYLATRLHWVDLAAVDRTPVLLLVIAIVVASYLLG
jgi:hypothetical protein